MKLENQVCTLKQAEKLSELGVEGESLFIWALVDLDDNYEWVLASPYDKEVRESDERLPAWTVAELGMTLPSDDDESVSILYFKDAAGKYLTRIKLMIDGVTHTLSQNFNTEAEARAESVIYLLESGKITAEQANKRLND